MTVRRRAVSTAEERETALSLLAAAYDIPPDIVCTTKQCLDVIEDGACRLPAVRAVLCALHLARRVRPSATRIEKPCRGLGQSPATIKALANCLRKSHEEKFTSLCRDYDRILDECCDQLQEHLRVSVDRTAARFMFESHRTVPWPGTSCPKPSTVVKAIVCYLAFIKGGVACHTSSRLLDLRQNCVEDYVSVLVCGHGRRLLAGYPDPDIVASAELMCL
jgi:hypothetical protein